MVELVFFNARCGHGYPSARGHEDHWASKDMCHGCDRMEGYRVARYKKVKPGDDGPGIQLG